MASSLTLPFSVSYENNEEDVVANLRWHMRTKSQLRWWPLIILLFLGFYTAFDWIPSRSLISQPANVYSVVALAFCFYIYFWLPKKAFRKLRPDQRRATVRLDEAHFELSTANASLRLAWSAVPRAILRRTTLLVFVNANVFYLIPRHAFASDEEFAAVCSFVNEHVIPNPEAAARASFPKKSISPLTRRQTEELIRWAVLVALFFVFYTIFTRVSSR